MEIKSFSSTNSDKTGFLRILANCDIFDEAKNSNRLVIYNYFEMGLVSLTYLEDGEIRGAIAWSLIIEERVFRYAMLLAIDIDPVYQDHFPTLLARSIEDAKDAFVVDRFIIVDKTAHGRSMFSNTATPALFTHCEHFGFARQKPANNLTFFIPDFDFSPMVKLWGYYPVYQTLQLSYLNMRKTLIWTEPTQVNRIEQALTPYRHIISIDWANWEIKYRESVSLEWNTLPNFLALFELPIFKKTPELIAIKKDVTHLHQKERILAHFLNPAYVDSYRIDLLQAFFSQNEETTHNYLSDRIMGIYELDADWNIQISPSEFFHFSRINGNSWEWLSKESHFADEHPDSFAYDILRNNAVVFIRSRHTNQVVASSILRWCIVEQARHFHEKTPNFGLEPVFYCESWEEILASLPQTNPSLLKGVNLTLPRVCDLSVASLNDPNTANIVIGQTGKLISHIEIRNRIVNICRSHGFPSYVVCKTPYTFEGYSDQMGCANTPITYIDDDE